MTSSDWLAASSLGIALIALLLSAYAINRANKTTSAATVVTLNECFRQAWARFLSVPQEEKEYEFAELLNLLEIASAIYDEGSLSGNAGILIFDYLNSNLGHIVNNEDANCRAGALLQDDSTFAFIRKFLKQEVNCLSVTVPVRWYEEKNRT